MPRPEEALDVFMGRLAERAVDLGRFDGRSDAIEAWIKVEAFSVFSGHWGVSAHNERFDLVISDEQCPLTVSIAFVSVARLGRETLRRIDDYFHAPEPTQEMGVLKILLVRSRPTRDVERHERLMDEVSFFHRDPEPRTVERIPLPEDGELTVYAWSGSSRDAETAPPGTRGPPEPRPQSGDSGSAPPPTPGLVHQHRVDLELRAHASPSTTLEAIENGTIHALGLLSLISGKESHVSVNVQGMFGALRRTAREAPAKSQLAVAAAIGLCTLARRNLGDDFLSALRNLVEALAGDSLSEMGAVTKRVLGGVATEDEVKRAIKDALADWGTTGRRAHRKP